MQRRKFVVGLGSLAAGGAAAMGTGAFTSVTAERNVDVAVANDADAYLGLSGAGGDNSEYVTDDGSSGTLSIDLDPGQNNSNAQPNGDGVNPNALTEVDYLFRIANQGTQDVDVSIAKLGDNPSLIEFYATPDRSATDPYGTGTRIDGSGSVTLTPGDTVYVSLQIDTRNAGLSDSDQIIDDVTINAIA